MVVVDDLVVDWTLVGDEWQLVAGKRGASRLGFAVLLKFYGLHGRFVDEATELPSEAVDLVASQVEIAADQLSDYGWSGRTNRYHRAQIREHYGFAECTVEDADRLTEWLAASVCVSERDAGRVGSELLAQCRSEQIEPPTQARQDRIVRSALHPAELALTARVAGRLSVEAPDDPVRKVVFPAVMVVRQRCMIVSVQVGVRVGGVQGLPQVRV